MKILCPCDTEKFYENCCKLLHEGAYPCNALALMRSRYSAYALQLPEYIIRTTHPDNPSYKREEKRWTQEILLFCRQTEFQKLEILDFIEGSEVSFVTFNAQLIQNRLPQQLIETSRFEKVEGFWLYRDAVSIQVKREA